MSFISIDVDTWDLMPYLLDLPTPALVHALTALRLHELALISQTPVLDVSTHTTYFYGRPTLLTTG